MSEWRKTPLGELCAMASGKTRQHDPRGIYPLFGSNGVIGNSTDRLADRGIVVGRVGAYCGSVKMATEPFWATDNTIVLCPKDAVDSTFLFAALRNARLPALAGGAAQPLINQGRLKALCLYVPDLPTQRRIAAFLSAFDKLIETNDRRIELLEDLARSLYREWFEHFRFPGHEDAEFVDSELGPIPQGWCVLPAESVLAPIGGGTPSKKCDDYWVDGQIPWFTPSDLTRASRRYVGESEIAITPRGLAESGARMFPPGSVLMTSRATLGVLAIATLDSTCNQGFIVIPPMEGIPPSFIYEWLSSHASELETIATGATFKEITRTAFKRFPFLRPDADILTSFGVLMQPLEEEIEIRERYNRHLAATRDLLLPRLVTGRLDISDVDLAGLLSAEAA